jgi:hypothetical protein
MSLNQRIKCLKEVEELFRKALLPATFKQGELTKLYAMTLSCQCLDDIKSILILVESKQDEGARILVRHLIEILFRLSANSRSSLFAGETIAGDEMSNESTMQKKLIAIDSKLEKVKTLGEQEQVEQLNKERSILISSIQIVKDKIKQFEARGIKGKMYKVKKIAEIGGTSGFYDSYYWKYSWSAHGNVIPLERYLKLSEARQIQGVIVSPLPMEEETLIFEAAVLAIHCFISFLRTFQLSEDTAVHCLKRLHAES